MELQNYNCKKCGLTISSTCSKCDRKVDVKVLDDGCLVQLTKCGDCANVPVIKDVCSQQKYIKTSKALIKHYPQLIARRFLFPFLQLRIL